MLNTRERCETRLMTEREESDSSEECIAEEIVLYVGGNNSRKYVVWWQGYDADDTSEEPARRFGAELPF